MKRRGFTLIELMVVIAIIIILAAIAIPNYLTMTARAKKSRVASDFASIATALETYKTDWNQYPVSASESVTAPGAGVHVELAGVGTRTAGTLVNTGTTAAGETAPIEYMTANILSSMVNPYSNASTAEYKYTGSLNHWLLVAPTVAAGTASTVLSRTDLTTALVGPSATPAGPSG